MFLSNTSPHNVCVDTGPGHTTKALLCNIRRQLPDVASTGTFLLGYLDPDNIFIEYSNELVDALLDDNGRRIVVRLEKRMVAISLRYI